MATVRSCISSQELKLFTQELEKKGKKYVVFKNKEPLFIRGQRIKYMVKYDIENETDINDCDNTFLYKG